MTNEVVNFFNTLIGAIAALLLALAWTSLGTIGIIALILSH
jgi:hypothetical protein